MAGVTSYLASDYGEVDEDQKTKDLARSLLDYVRLRLREFPDRGLIVDIAELAFRFRETEWTIEGALRLLESRGLSHVSDNGTPSTSAAPRRGLGVMAGFC
jgi:hypothetical protein